LGQINLDNLKPLTYKNLSLDTVYRILGLISRENLMDNIFGGVKIGKRKPLREVVYDSLKKSILHGKLKAGQRLIEETLANQIGISRTPVM